MPIPPGTFAHAKPLNAGLNQRAYADVVVTDPTGVFKSSILQCLVDTGSDYTILPVAAATAAHIVPAGPMVAFRSAGGALYHLQSQLGVRLVVEGYAIIVRVVFSPAAGFSPILGRCELLAAFDVGMDNTHWHWG